MGLSKVENLPDLMAEPTSFETWHSAKKSVNSKFRIIGEIGIDELHKLTQEKFSFLL